MDQIVSQSVPKCIKHSQKKIKFVQVNDITNSENNNFFYCTSCINKDLDFKGINFLLISQIVDEGQTKIIQKWPPINDYSIIDKLISLTEEQDTSQSVVHQINTYFTQLKEEFLKKIDLCQKKMINRALELPLGQEQIIKQYQDISQIIQMRDSLIQNEKKDIEIRQQVWREFVTSVESKKEENTQLLTNLLSQCSEKKKLINFEYPNQIKNSIFTFLDQIDFFDSKNNSQNQNESTNISNIIMKLISNKSNFCSQNFITQLQKQLEKVSPILQTISVESVYENNKYPIDFSKLSQIKLDLIKDYVEHSVKIEQNADYAQNIQNTHQLKYLEQLIESNVNFVHANLKQQFKSYLIDTYPFLNKVNFTNQSTKNEVFDCFRQLNEEEIDDVYQLILKRKQLVRDQDYNLSCTNLFQKKVKNRSFFDFQEKVEVILRKYPIFDLMIKQQFKDLLPDIKLLNTKFQDGIQRTQIVNHQVSINEQNYSGKFGNGCNINCISNMTLEKQVKYIFRFKITHNRQDSYNFYLGLMQKNRSEKTQGYNDQMTCTLCNNLSQIQLQGSYGVDKYIRGNKLELNQENEIEMRVWLGGQLLEFLNYPDHQNKISIKDENKNKLTSLNDLCLYIGMQKEQLFITLTSAMVVEDFPN